MNFSTSSFCTWCPECSKTWNARKFGSMSRNGERTVLTYVGDGQTLDVTETPEQILERHLGPMGKA